MVIIYTDKENEAKEVKWLVLKKALKLLSASQVFIFLKLYWFFKFEGRILCLGQFFNVWVLVFC